MPPVKTSYVDIPGASGKLDLSESLTKYPVYDNRTGSIDFIVLNNYQTNDKSWLRLYESIAEFVHGKRLKMVLEDDKLGGSAYYYYEGRFDISWNSDNSGKWSTVTFNYDLEPYKYNSLGGDIFWNLTQNGGAHWTINDNYLNVSSMPTIPTFEIANIGSYGVDIELVNDELGIHTTKSIEDNGTYTFYDMILSNIHKNNTLELNITGHGQIKITWRNGEL